MEFKVPIKVGDNEIETVVDVDINHILDDIPKKLLPLIMKGDFRLDEEDHLSKLDGVKSVKKGLTVKDRSMVAIAFKGEIDRDKVISEYPLDYLQIAKRAGGQSVLVTKKDHPCFIRLNDDGWFMVIAPRVSTD